MKYIKLGNSDLNVSRICMGCMGFGDSGRGQHSWTIDEEHSREIIKRGLELGVNFYDTAIGYQSGTSEQYLGRALRTASAGGRHGTEQTCLSKGKTRLDHRRPEDQKVTGGNENGG